jgi:hypothetical protein
VAFKTSDAQRFARHVVPHVVRPARIIWNQVLGSLFLVLALTAYSSAWQSYHAPAHEQGDTVRFWIAMVFGAGMTAFAIHAFLRARKLSRS